MKKLISIFLISLFCFSNASYADYICLKKGVAIKNTDSLARNIKIGKKGCPKDYMIFVITREAADTSERS